MRIDITGYVTETHGKDGFTIKVTCDAVQYLSFRNIQISREVRVLIHSRYPWETKNVFQEISMSQRDDPRNRKIAESHSLSNALRMGDRVKCSVFIVKTEIHNRRETFVINRDRKDIEAYADFPSPLWLYPDPQLFKRLEVDSPESLKFRKEWFYTCRNREKYKKITGSEWNDYRNKWWINKNPTIILPIIWWIQVKTTVSNLWERLTRQENSPKTIAHKLAIIGIVATIVVGIISIVLGIIGIVVTLLF